MKLKVKNLTLSFSLLLSSCGIEVSSFKMNNPSDIDIQKFREDLKSHSVLFTKAVKEELATSESYRYISGAINFMKLHIANFELKDIEEVTIVVGASGAGKSTTLNYLGEQENLVVAKGKKLKLKENGISISQIGSGKGSTTVFPIVCKMPFGILIDCAGEGDTGGVIAQAINAYTKCKMAQGIKKIKILFVAPQSSLGHEGQYGANFKAALDANATFLNNINIFKKSVSMVITNAESDEDPDYAIEEAKSMLKDIMEGTASTDFKAYHETLNYIVENNRIKSFLKPSTKEGTIYKEPEENPSQRQGIIDMIANLPYTEVPDANFFKVPESLEVRSAMKIALHIVQMRLADEIKTAFMKSNKTVNLYSAEIPQFIKFIESIMGVGFSTTPDLYIKYLSYNNYIKIDTESSFINAISEEIMFIGNYLDSLNGLVENKNSFLKQNWLRLAEDKEFENLLNELHTSTAKLYGKPNFVLSLNKDGVVTTKFACSESGTIQGLIKEFKDLCKNKSDLENKSKDNQSEYYKDVTKEVLDRIEKLTVSKFKQNKQVKTGTRKVVRGTKTETKDETIDTTESYISGYKKLYKPKVKTIAGRLCGGVFRTEAEVAEEHSAAKDVYLNSASDCGNHTDHPSFYRYTGSCNLKFYYDKKYKSFYSGTSKEFVCNLGGHHLTHCPSDWFDSLGTDHNVNGKMVPMGNIVPVKKQTSLEALVGKHPTATQELPDGEEEIGEEPIYKEKPKTETKTITYTVPNEVDEDVFTTVPEYENVIEEKKIMKNEIVRELDSEKYNKDVENLEKLLSEKKSQLAGYFLPISNFNCPVALPEIIIDEEEPEELKTFLENWQKLEFLSYSKLPNKSFNALGI